MNFINKLFPECDCHACILIEGTPDKYWCNYHKVDVSKKWEEKARQYRIKKNNWLLNSLQNIILDKESEMYILEIKDELRRDSNE